VRAQTGRQARGAARTSISCARLSAALGAGLRAAGPVSLRGLIRIYRWTLSPLLGPSCRFEPSCSVYAEEVLASQPFGRALWLVGRRLARCHPFHPGGLDLPPAKPEGVLAASVLKPIRTGTKG